MSKTLILLMCFAVAPRLSDLVQNSNPQDDAKATKAERDAENRADKNAGTGRESGADQSKVAERAQAAASALEEITNIPEKGIPNEILADASCVVMLPGVKKAGFIIGARYGRGFATCRIKNENGWSAPAPVFMGGGSYGAQIGAEGVDLLLLIMNDKGVQRLLSSKFEIGVDASAAAGPVGRSASAGTNWKMNSEILSYSRAKGLFAGVELNGAKMRQDDDATKQLYGRVIPFRDLLSGSVPTPPEARAFVDEVHKDFREAKASK